MTTVRINRIINAPADQVWQVIGDYNNVHVFHPFVESADQLSEVARGLGAKRQCNLYNNSCAVEEVIQWEEGRSFTVAMSTPTPPFGGTTGTMSVQPIDASTSEVTLDMFYTPQWGFFGKTLDLLVLRMVLRFVLNRVLKSLQHHIETGELVGKHGKPIPLPLHP